MNDMIVLTVMVVRMDKMVDLSTILSILIL